MENICGIESALYFLLHMEKCMICYFLAWKRLAYLIKFLRNDFMDLLHYLQNLIIGKVDAKHF